MRNPDETMDDLYRRLLLALSPEERLAMGCRMFGTARRLIIAGLKREHPNGLSPMETRVQLFLRLYGNDFDETEREKIVEHLRGQGTSAEG
jgi:hypothetical protein